MALSTRLRTPAAVAAITVAVLTLLATIGYVAQRQRDVTSTAQLVLVPTGDTPDLRIQQLQSFGSSGVQGTFVEYLAAIRTPGATLEVRAVPDSRVIDLRVTRPAEAQSTLQDVLVTALRNQRRTADDWSARLLSRPSAETAAGPASSVLLAAGLLLALLAAVGAFAGVRAVLPGSGSPSPEAAAEADDPVVDDDGDWDATPATRPAPRSFAQVR